jgi:hypothetical protein
MASSAAQRVIARPFASALVLLRPPELKWRESLAPETRAELLGPRLTFSRAQNSRSVCNMPFRALCCAHSLRGRAGAICRRSALPFRASLPFRLARTAE